MAELSTIARPYAEALFQVALTNPANIAGLSEELKKLAQVSEVNDVREVMADPRLDKDQRVSVFTGLLNEKLSEHMQNFIRLLVDNNRLLLLPEIAHHFEVLKNQREGSASCEITSAYELSDAQVQELSAMLEKKFGYKLKPVVTVDKSLIGGIKVTVGDQVLDTSVQGKLNRLRETLATV